jgi:DNA-binding HxlR family transcriptional regulator
MFALRCVRDYTHVTARRLGELARQQGKYTPRDNNATAERDRKVGSRWLLTLVQDGLVKRAKHRVQCGYVTRYTLTQRGRAKLASDK